MRKILILFAVVPLSFSTALSLEPVKVAFTHSGTGSISVEIKLTDYTGGTANTLYTQSATSYTPNGSGIIVATVAGAGWTAITPAQVNAYCVLDVYVGGILYAQYRLDQLILSQSSNSSLDNDGNLTPAESGGADLGNDDNRWGELFLTGNTLHVGPDGGMAGSNELAISYDDTDNSAHFTVAGTDALTVTTGSVKAPQDFFAGDGVENYGGSGIEKKMYFDYGTGSFRAGGIDVTQWNTRGDYSFASGYNTEASGDYSTAMGYFTTASGDHSTAMGYGTTASGYVSTAMGNGTEASGNNSTAMGYQTEANGETSTAMGYFNVADADNSVAMGIFNDNSITGELLTIGNGNSTTRSNAFEVYMNGNVVVPNGSLKVTELGNGSSTQNLQVDANGKLVASSSVVVTFSATAPSSPSAGTFWYDTANSQLKLYDGSTWIVI